MAEKPLIRLIPFVLFVILTNPFSAYCMPSFEDVKNEWSPSDIVIYDQKDRLIQTVRSDYKKRALQWVGINDISKNLVDAVLVSEDKRFFKHKGVDWLALGSAFFENITGRSKRGASTITMQLVSILQGERGKKDYSKKLKQINSARELEENWTKGQILEAYLNLVYFRGELQGISSAAHILFDKSPSALDVVESAILASLIRQPNAPLESIAFRTRDILQKMNFPYDESRIKSIVSERLQTPKNPPTTNPNIAPHIVKHLDLASKKTLKTTIDTDLQMFSEETLKKHLISLKRNNVNDGAVIIIENKTGNVLAYLSQSTDSVFVDGIVAKRQAGSTLKPFLYAIALEKGILHTASLLDDSPVSITTERGLYLPKNYTESYKGLVTLRTALASSLNTPAVKTLTLAGIDDFHEYLLKLGFDISEKADFYGYSLALGGIDVSLLELSNAFRVLANGGKLSGLQFINTKERIIKKRVMDEAVSFIISDILSDRSARQVTFGFENPLSTRSWSAVKTGTSKDMRDNWCIGFSDTYTVGVWVGNFSGAPMWNVSGVSGSAHVWQEIMNYLHRFRLSKPPKPPQNVIKKDIYVEPTNTTITDWFINNGKYYPADNTLARITKHQHMARISYPPNSTVFVIDPDIPKSEQAVFFEVSGSDKGLRIFVGDDEIAIDGNIAIWHLKAGFYKVKLIDKDGVVKDEIEIVVR